MNDSDRLQCKEQKERLALTLPSPAKRERVAEGRVRVFSAFFCG
jgi:hypothetical protein